MTFAKTLQHWYLQNKRDLPWRNSNDPYHIWLSEIILQQTRVAQGMPYFLSFTTAFPTVFDLANASEQQVLKLWQGLGYYSRARNLHKTAQIISFEKNGVFPQNYSDLLYLKGVGDYTAAAIASFAYNERVPVVDGNVFRVLSRYVGIENDIADAKSRIVFKETALQLMDSVAPNVFNQAIMEFGALQCVPKNPNCFQCVFSDSCFALQQNRVGELPLKAKKARAINKYFNYLIFIDDAQKTMISQRTEKGIWQNLYEFPLLETTKNDFEGDIIDLIKKQKFIENTTIEIKNYADVAQVHKLTHQHLHIRFWKIQVDGLIKNGITVDDAKKHPFPIVIHNFLEQNF